MVSQTLLSDMSGDVGSHEDRIFSLLFKEDELTWQTIIYDLVKSESMDPWDVNVSLIAQKFIERLGKMKEFDFHVSGKVVLAAALLLKIKSERLMKEDIMALDNLISGADDSPELLDELIGFAGVFENAKEHVSLVPRTPQPRQRKVSVYDLVEALEKALGTESRKQVRHVTQAPTMVAPKKGKDMSERITDIFGLLRKKLGKNMTVSFDQLTPSRSKQDMVLTFVPLLHLDTLRKIDLIQNEHFGEILVQINPV